MKLILAFLLGAALAIAAVADPPSLPATLQTLDGKHYKGASLSRVVADGILIIHDDGTARIKWENVPDELRKPLGYEPPTTAPAAAPLRAFQHWKDALAKARTKAEMDKSETAALEVKIAMEELDGARIAVDSFTGAKVTEAFIQQCLDAAAEKRLIAGMTSAFVLTAWGVPLKMGHKMKTSEGMFESWYYKEATVSFRNQILYKIEK